MAVKKLLLAGSGEFTEAMYGVDAEILSAVDSPKVAIIPAAAGKERDYWKWVDMGVSHYKKLGIPAFGVDIRTRTDADVPSIVSELQTANCYYFSGGDPGYLLSVFSGSAAWECIHASYLKGALLAGSSAGAMIMGSAILSNIQDVFDKGARTYAWDSAFNLVPYAVWPHFDYALRQARETLLLAMEKSPAHVRKSWVGIDENTAVYFQDGMEPKIMGLGKVHWNTIRYDAQGI